MAEIRVNATGGLKLFDADDSHYAQIIAGTITSNVNAITLGHDVVSIVDNLALTSDSAVLKFGADNDTTLTHTDGTGLTLNSTNKLCFNAASQFVQGSSATVLSIGATDEIDLTATAIDINGTCDISGTFSLGGTNITSTAAEINLIDGGTSRGTTALADGDGILINDAGTMRMTNVTAVKTYMKPTLFGSGLTDVAMDIANLENGLIIQTDSDGSAPGTGTLSSADNNIGIGRSVFAALTSGDSNTAINSQALEALTTGSRNTAIGVGSLVTCDGENDNVAIGFDAMNVTNSGGEYNVAVGNYAGDAITSGDKNTCIGHEAGSGITTGSSNTCIGRSAGDAITTGGTLIMIGDGTNPSANDSTYAICLGNNFSTPSNNFSFGKASNVVTNDFDTDADWSRSSDLRLKRNIQDSTLGLDFINDLRPIKFQWKPSNEVPKEMTAEYNEENQKNLDYISHGFIAQEVKEAIDKHGDTTFGGWHLDKTDNETQRVKKNMFVMPLIKAVQELTARVKELEAK